MDISIRKFWIGPLFSYVAAIEFCSTLETRWCCFCIWYWLSIECGRYSLWPAFARLHSKQCQHGSCHVVVREVLRLPLALLLFRDFVVFVQEKRTPRIVWHTRIVSCWSSHRWMARKIEIWIQRCLVRNCISMRFSFTNRQTYYNYITSSQQLVYVWNV